MGKLLQVRNLQTLTSILSLEETPKPGRSDCPGWRGEGQSKIFPYKYLLTSESSTLQTNLLSVPISYPRNRKTYIRGKQWSTQERVSYGISSIGHLKWHSASRNPACDTVYNMVIVHAFIHSSNMRNDLCAKERSIHYCIQPSP